MNMPRRIVITCVLALCVAVGIAVPAATQITPPTIPAPRYQVISDMLDMQQRIEALEQETKELRRLLYAGCSI